MVRGTVYLPRPSANHSQLIRTEFFFNQEDRFFILFVMDLLRRQFRESRAVGGNAKALEVFCGLSID